MKPKTKLEKQVVELSTQLPKITEKQAQWAYEKCFDSYAARLRNNLYCLDCGHTWKDESPDWHNELVGCTCPKCNTELKMFQNNHNGNCRKTEYFSVLTTMGNFQVHRVIIIHKDMKKKTPSRNHYSEVIQHWIGIDGRKTTISLACNGMSMYYDQWVYGSSLEVRTASDQSSMRDDLDVFPVYPVRKILPIIKRNGFKVNFHDIKIHKLFSMIISDSLAETFIKTKQFSLLRYYSEAKGNISATWLVPIKICIRNNYIIKDITTWIDYIQLLIYFRKDLSNSKFVCPDDLKLAHDRLVAKKRAIQKRQKLHQMRQEIEEAQVQYIAQKEKFFGLEFVSKNITVKVIESVRDFMEEGDELYHCVFTNEYYKKADSLVLSARIENKPIETVEVSLSDMKIVQARGLRNKTSKYHKDILSLVNSNLHQIKAVSRNKVAV